MSKQDFINNYPKKGGKARYNAAIREEIHGGDELLDTLELISSMRRREPSNTALRVIEDRLQITRDAMVAGINRDYNI